MIQANELRIGNYVLFSEEDTIWRIEEIDQKGIVVTDGHETVWIELEHFAPIPLTEKWLVKFGFKKVMRKDNYITYNNGIKRISINSNGSVMRGHGIWFKYVHQLQNLYFALTGTELTIKS